MGGQAVKLFTNIVANLSKRRSKMKLNTFRCGSNAKLIRLLVVILLSTAHLSCLGPKRYYKGFSSRTYRSNEHYVGESTFKMITEGWRISFHITSMRWDKKGEGVEENKYRTFAWMDLIGKDRYVSCYSSKTSNPGWISIDTLKFTFLPTDETVTTNVDSNWIFDRFHENAEDSYCFGINYPFNIISVPPEVDSMMLSFNAHLFDPEGELIKTETFEAKLFRHEQQSRGASWFRRFFIE